MSYHIIQCIQCKGNGFILENQGVESNVGLVQILCPLCNGNKWITSMYLLCILKKCSNEILIKTIKLMLLKIKRC